MSQNETKSAPKKKPVNPDLYKKYADLKFLQLDGANLKDEQIDSIKKMESEIKKCSGKISKHTKTASIGAEVLKLVQGIPVPKEYIDIISKYKDGKFSKEHLDYYF